MRLLAEKVKKYQEVLNNTLQYRLDWHTTTKPFLKDVLQKFLTDTGLKATIIEKAQIENLELLALDLGRSPSGLAENIDNTDIQRVMIKSNGMLVYQQLFNGKIMAMIHSPVIEGYGQPKPPFAIDISRPAEITEPLILKHIEYLLEDVTEWEDYDDVGHDPAPQGFEPIGFTLHPEQQVSAQ